MLKISRGTNDSGAVTAELVLALPAVMLVVLVTIAAMGLQVERMKLVGAASAIARSIARAESLEVTETLYMELSPAASMEISELEGLVCVELILDSLLPGMGLELLQIKEKQCARAAGL
jgi:hypothetical protein